MRALPLIFCAAVAALSMVAGANADPETDFFRGQTVTLYIGYGPGGAYDLYSRLFAAYLGRHLPGNPAVVPRNQPGAGSLKLANELYNVMPKDGTALGMIGEVLVINQGLGDRLAQFDAQKFTWIGRLVDSDPVLVMRPDAPVATIKDAFTKQAIIGVPGSGSATLLTLTVLNHLLGTKFKPVSGYDGTAQIRLAVENGEVQGTASPWRTEQDWARQLNLHVIYQASLERDPELLQVPTVVQLARTDDERKMLRFFSSYTVIGRSIIAPPGLPASRVATLRAAFDATVADPDFLADAKQTNLELAVMPGDKLAALVRDTVALSSASLDAARWAAGMTSAGK